MRIDLAEIGFGDGAMRRKILCGAVLLAMGFLTMDAHADTFVKPTPEELSMTSLPGYPGVAAVVLYREEITHDDLNVVDHYDRIKILTEDGKKYANVELPFVTTNEDNEYGGNDKTLGEIQGRTIHADGTIIPFTGKPYLKVMEKGKGIKYQAKIFTLPDAEVGSIIEYRYATRIADNRFESPHWIIQGELYVKAAHYEWLPTKRQLVDYKERSINSISWFPLLPPGVTVVHTVFPASSSMEVAQQEYDLTIKDVPPMVKEEYMPPIASYSYRVLFSFTPFHNPAEYWKEEGKEWSRKSDSFANPNGELKAATQTVIAGATTDEEKLKKIYAAVMDVENTRFTREHEQREEKAEGGGKVKTAADVLSHKRGSPTQLTQLFVGMARAAGMKAYLMLVPDRSEELFISQWLSFDQFDDVIAIVNVGGKEVFFDPGWRYASYGHLAWEHTYVRGLRQTDGGTDFAQTQGDDYHFNQTQRVADLHMDDKGEVTGTVKLTFLGSPALIWRHSALSGDAESMNRELRKELEDMVPKSLEVKVGAIEGVDAYESPLVVNYEVKGTLGTTTGKRLLLPADIFEAGATASFPHEKREQAVYFHYPQATFDAMRIKFPQGFQMEATPDAATFDLPGLEEYKLGVTTASDGFLTRRTHARGEVLVQTKDYDTLRKFYTQFESKDQESVVLKVVPAGTAAGGN